RITRLLDRFNARFNRLAESYRGVIAWALDHRAAMVTIAVGSLVAAFTLPAKGISGMLVVLAGLTVAVLVMTRRRLAWPVRTIGVVVAFVAAFAALGVVPAWGKVGAGFFPADDQSELN